MDTDAFCDLDLDALATIRGGAGGKPPPKKPNAGAVSANRAKPKKKISLSPAGSYSKPGPSSRKSIVKPAAHPTTTPGLRKPAPPPVPKPSAVSRAVKATGNALGNARNAPGWVGKVGRVVAVGDMAAAAGKVPHAPSLKEDARSAFLGKGPNGEKKSVGERLDSANGVAGTVASAAGLAADGAAAGAKRFAAKGVAKKVIGVAGKVNRVAGPAGVVFGAADMAKTLGQKHSEWKAAEARGDKQGARVIKARAVQHVGRGLIATGAAAKSPHLAAAGAVLTVGGTVADQVLNPNSKHHQSAKSAGQQYKDARAHGQSGAEASRLAAGRYIDNWTDGKAGRAIDKVKDWAGKDEK
jgi:hypothetical protein